MNTWVVRYISKIAFVMPFLLFSLTSYSQGVADDEAEFLHPWASSCHQDKCMMDTMVLRGDPESKAQPNPRDPDAYIWMGMKLKRGEEPLQLMAISVDPKAQCDSGVSIAFINTIKNGNALSVKEDENGVVSIPFTRCDPKSRLAEVPFGKIKKGGGNIQLLDKFKTSDIVWISYVKQGEAYRTMIDLSGFKAKYKEVSATLNNVTP